MTKASVIQSFLPAKCKGRILKLTLNKPNALNAIDVGMIRLLTDYLVEAKNDNSIVAVFIDGAGGRAFCAGGDVVSLRSALSNTRALDIDNFHLENIPEPVIQFFVLEYQFDYLLHNFPKPLIAWGSGLVMGGGMGLFCGANIRIATETTRIAMPEISIGLFPDVGASYFLNHLPDGVGLFLGLTGVAINNYDAFTLKIATNVLPRTSKVEFLDFLVSIDINDVSSLQYAINQYAKDIGASDKLNQSTTVGLKPLVKSLASLNKAQNVFEAEELLLNLGHRHKNEFTRQAIANYQYGSPITAHLVFQQLLRAKNQELSLADCFRMELSMALSCMILGEFKEGVRALLVDKDKNPNWRYKSIKDVPFSLIDAHFTYFESEYSPTNPLNKLGE